MSFVKYINLWLKDIVILFIFISIAELIMPKGNMKRYINLIIGLLIILTIINPLVKLIKLDLNLEQGVFNYSKESTLEIDKFYNYQEKQIENLYKEKLSKEIISFLEEETEYRVISIEIDLIGIEDENYEINYLKIQVGEETELVGNNIIAVEKVASVTVQNKVEKDKNINIKEKEEFVQLKKKISMKYTIEENNILIVEEKKGNGE